MITTLAGVKLHPGCKRLQSPRPLLHQNAIEFGKLLGQTISLFVFDIHAHELFLHSSGASLALLGPVALAEPHARAAAGLVDEFDAVEGLPHNNQR
jgi:hypothetical protein